MATNNATLGGNALMGASGNIGVNVAAGSTNQQRNELSASVNTSGTMAKASTWGVQETWNNTVGTSLLIGTIENTVRVNMSGELGGGYIGVGSGAYAGGTHQVDVRELLPDGQLLSGYLERQPESPERQFDRPPRYG
ncbi:MAG: hypothetical protein M5R42_14565 [Rhodocyclaceae bacterium]|nr:hypothetical protein [Rhodocyclaceae bacterium]